MALSNTGVKAGAKGKSGAISETKSETLAYPDLKFYYIFDAAFTKFFKLEGFVLYPFVFITQTKEKTLPSILKHELTHVTQVRREGPLKFYAKYLYYIYKSRQQNGDYENVFFYNEYEDEAYENQKNPLTDAEILETKWEGLRSNAKKNRKRKNNRW
jgi:hypothetical protein